MPFCNQCGKKLEEDSSFCTNCGASVRKVKMAEPSVMPENANPIPALENVSETAQVEPAAASDMASETAGTEPAAPGTAPEIVYAEPPAASEEPLQPAYAQPAEISFAPPAYNAPPPLAYGAAPLPPIYQATPPMYSAPPQYKESAAAASGRNTFVNSYLGIVVFAVFFIGLLTTGVLFAPGLLSANSLFTICDMFFLYALIALAVVVSTRAKGPDFSIGAVMMMSAILTVKVYMLSGSLILSILASLFACAVIGVINGALITYLRTPAIITTLLVGIISSGAGYFISNSMGIRIDDPEIMMIFHTKLAGISLWGLGLLVAAFIAVFLMVMLTKLGLPTYKREQKPALSYMSAYMASAMIASLAGLLYLSLYTTVLPGGSDYYTPFILFVFACIAGSRVLDNRIAPAIYALVPALYYSILCQILLCLGLAPMWRTVIGGTIVLILVVIAFIARRAFTPRSRDTGIESIGLE